jgi:methylated-DNA-[protein]-cysteine S-methyltransferase
MPAMGSLSITTPVGRLRITARDGAVRRVDWLTPGKAPTITPEDGDAALLEDASAQLQGYFEGRLRVFDLPLAPKGSAFEQQVFTCMRAIPFGQTRRYGEIAAELGTYGQPVGRACGAHPIPVIIPSHRVLAKDGLGGYSGAGGIETKIKLLRHENAYPYLV